MQSPSAAKEEWCQLYLSPQAAPALGPLTVIQGHLPLWGDSTGLQTAIIPGQRRDEAGMVHGAHRPLLLILWEVWPRKQQDVREGSAHQHLSLEETRGYPSSRSLQPTWTAEQLHLTWPLTLTTHAELRPWAPFLKPGPGTWVQLEQSRKEGKTEETPPNLGPAHLKASLNHQSYCWHFPSDLLLEALRGGEITDAESNLSLGCLLRISSTEKLLRTLLLRVFYTQCALGDKSEATHSQSRYF